MGKLKFFLTLSIIMHFCTIFYYPVRAEDSNFTANIDSHAAYLLDWDTNSVLYAKNETETLEPASLTKVMTALLVLEYSDNLDQLITVSQSALDSFYDHPSALDSTKADLVVGEQMSVRNLLYCMLVSSSGDAACVLAEYVSGSEAAFAEQMTLRAAELGCVHTNFTNPHGLHSSNHYSTASDLAKIALAALQYDSFVTICNTASIEIPATNLHGMRYLKTTNYLLSTNTVGGYVYSRACGVKTGYTSQAGYCLISTAQNSKMKLLGVVMGATATDNGDGSYTIHSFKDMVTLFEYGFNHFTSADLLSPLDIMTEVPVHMAVSGSDVAVLSPTRAVTTMLPADYDSTLVRREIQLRSEELIAPIEAGEILGSVSVYYDNQLIDTVDLAAIAKVERSELKYWKQQLLLYWEKTWVKVAVLGIVFLFALYLFRLCFPRKRHSARRHYRR